MKAMSIPAVAAVLASLAFAAAPTSQPASQPTTQATSKRVSALPDPFTWPLSVGQVGRPEVARVSKLKEGVVLIASTLRPDGRWGHYELVVKDWPATLGTSSINVRSGSDLPKLRIADGPTPSINTYGEQRWTAEIVK